MSFPHSTRTVAAECIRGEKIICLCITEPYAGSDVAQIQTTGVCVRVVYVCVIYLCVSVVGVSVVCVCVIYLCVSVVCVRGCVSVYACVCEIVFVYLDVVMFAVVYKLIYQLPRQPVGRVTCTF